jgi:hypothetical protein
MGPYVNHRKNNDLGNIGQICYFLFRSVSSFFDGLTVDATHGEGWIAITITDARPEIGKFVRDQGFRKILPQVYG